MPSDDPELKEVEHRLRTFVRCVIDKASADSDFAEQIKQVFLSETLRQTLSAKGHKKPKREVFDLVAFLGQHDAQLLRKELENKLISELAEIAKQYRVVPSKSIKGMEKNALLEKLLTHAARKLNQGAVFLRSQSTLAPTATSDGTL